MPGSNYDRDLSVKEGFVLSKFLVKWEMILVYILILLNLVLLIFKPELFFQAGTIQTIINSGFDSSPLVLGMVFILLLGDIDVSVAAQIVLGGMVTGLMMNAGIPSIICVLAGILTCVLCGAFNGFCVAYFKMPAVITTISTSMLFRGIAEIVLGENSLKNFPAWYNKIGWYNIGGIIPLSMVLFLIMGAILIFVLHKSPFGRKVYIVGNNPTCATYSGISVFRVKMECFMLMGLMAGIGSIFFIGRNLDYAMGLEGSLKLKEISYIHSEAYASGELKHGTISLIEDGTLVIALGTYAPLFDKAMSNVVEVQARGADVLAVTTESHVAEMKKTVENVIAVPESHTIFQPSLGVVPLQLFAYYVALLRGCDIDKPRNLAKSVTVE